MTGAEQEAGIRGPSSSSSLSSALCQQRLATATGKKVICSSQCQQESRELRVRDNGLVTSTLSRASTALSLLSSFPPFPDLSLQAVELDPFASLKSLSLGRRWIWRASYVCYQHAWNPGFLNLSTVAVLGWITLCFRGLSCAL